MNSTKKSNEISENFKKERKKNNYKEIIFNNPFLRSKDLFDKENEIVDKIKVSVGPL